MPNSLDCQCYPTGSINDGACEDGSGKCTCLDNFSGDKCDECNTGYESSQTNDDDSGENYSPPSGETCDKCVDGYYKSDGKCVGM